MYKFKNKIKDYTNTKLKLNIRANIHKFEFVNFEINYNLCLFRIILDSKKNAFVK